MPLSIDSSFLEKVLFTQSRNKKREAKKANVAPMLEAKEANNNPQPKPNNAPAPNVRIAAPGTLKAVAAA